MIDLIKLQKEIFENKVRRGFNTTDICKEIVAISEELGELARAYKLNDKKEMVNETGDIMVFCLGLFEILGVNGEGVLTKIVENNKNRSHEGYY